MQRSVTPAGAANSATMKDAIMSCDGTAVGSLSGSFDLTKDLDDGSKIVVYLVAEQRFQRVAGRERLEELQERSGPSRENLPVHDHDHRRVHRFPGRDPDRVRRQLGRHDRDLLEQVQLAQLHRGGRDPDAHRDGNGHRHRDSHGDTNGHGNGNGHGHRNRDGRDRRRQPTADPTPTGGVEGSTVHPDRWRPGSDGHAEDDASADRDPVR